MLISWVLVADVAVKYSQNFYVSAGRLHVLQLSCEDYYASKSFF